MTDELLIFGIVAIILMVIGGAMMSGGQYNDGVLAMAQAIAQAEGFYSNGSIPQLANNPGDLTRGDVGDTGQYLTAAGGIQIIRFATAADGWDALYRKLQHIVTNQSSVYSASMTLSQFGSIYSGNDPNWIRNVADAIGESPNNTLDQILA